MASVFGCCWKSGLSRSEETNEAPTCADNSRGPLMREGDGESMFETIGSEPRRLPDVGYMERLSIVPTIRLGGYDPCE